MKLIKIIRPIDGFPPAKKGSIFLSQDQLNLTNNMDDNIYGIYLNKIKRFLVLVYKNDILFKDGSNPNENI